jgi:hypothetical protein
MRRSRCWGVSTEDTKRGAGAGGERHCLIQDVPTLAEMIDTDVPLGANSIGAEGLEVRLDDAIGGLCL